MSTTTTSILLLLLPPLPLLQLLRPPLLPMSTGSRHYGENVVAFRFVQTHAGQYSICLLCLWGAVCVILHLYICASRRGARPCTRALFFSPRDGTQNTHLLLRRIALSRVLWVSSSRLDISTHKVCVGWRCGFFGGHFVEVCHRVSRKTRRSNVVSKP
jgi:hypothetical protein